MRITLLALGSRGDVQPFVPLGAALRERGHRVRVASFEMFRPLFTGAGLGFHAIAGDAQALVSAASEGMLTGGRNPLTAFLALRRSYARLADGIGRDLADPALADTELILNQLPGNIYGADLAERLGIRSLALGVLPLTRTRAWPMLAFPPAPTTLPAYNLFSYRLAEGLLWQLFGSAIQRWRKAQLGLRRLPALGPWAERRASPMIYGFSEHVVPRPPDWGDQIAITGWWLPRWPDWRPSIDLQRFVEDSDPPVYIGFGSMPVSDAAGLTRTIVDGVRLSGRRAVLNAGWAGLGGELPASILGIDQAPYDWLFPRMSAVIHHGGSGTVGFGLTHGRPSQIVPFGFDQFFWGARIRALGSGPPPLPIHRLTPQRLADSITRLTRDPRLRERASALGRIMQAEDGPTVAVSRIESLAG
ncbi:MAG TPA: glycosyltransferase [Anaerolineales bacterium]|nr:glycosyltransferase [Anaerolineales bacterium]